MSSRKRARNHIQEITGGGGGAGTISGKIEWGPDFGDAPDDNTYTVQDEISLSNINLEGNLAENVATDLDKIGLTGNLGENLAIDLASVNLEGNLSPQAGISDVDARIIDMIPQEDTYLDQGNDTSNFGSATDLLCRQANALGNQQQVAYIAWDLTGFNHNFVNTVAEDLQFTVRRTDGLVNANLNWQLYSNSTKPFEEDTATWANTEQPPGTQLATGSFDSLGTSFVTRTINVSNSDMNTAIGNWLYVRFIGETGLGNTTQFAINSKESANDPLLNMDLDIS